jgi:hypothetical protein
MYLKLRYIHEYRDRHGKLRRYFRRAGHKDVPLRGTPGSKEFLRAYCQAAVKHLENAEPVARA